MRKNKKTALRKLTLKWTFNSFARESFRNRIAVSEVVMNVMNGLAASRDEIMKMTVGEGRTRWTLSLSVHTLNQSVRCGGVCTHNVLFEKYHHSMESIANDSLIDTLTQWVVHNRHKCSGRRASRRCCYWRVCRWVRVHVWWHVVVTEVVGGLDAAADVVPADRPGLVTGRAADKVQT